MSCISPTNEWISYTANSKTGSSHIYINNSPDNLNEFTIGVTSNPHDLKKRYETKYGRCDMIYKIISGKENLEQIVLTILDNYRQKDSYTGSYSISSYSRSSYSSSSSAKRFVMNKEPLMHVIDWCINNYEYINIRTSTSRSTIAPLNDQMLTNLCIYLIEYFNVSFPVPMEVEDEDGGSSYAHNFTKIEFNKIISVC